MSLQPNNSGFNFVYYPQRMCTVQTVFQELDNPFVNLSVHINTNSKFT